jgi:hypothetical protein
MSGFREYGFMIQGVGIGFSVKDSGQRVEGVGSRVKG